MSRKKDARPKQDGSETLAIESYRLDATIDSRPTRSVAALSITERGHP